MPGPENYPVIRTVREPEGKYIHISDFINYLNLEEKTLPVSDAGAVEVKRLVEFLDSFNKR